MILSHHRTVATRPQHPDRDRVLVHVHVDVHRVGIVHTGHGRLLPYVAPSPLRRG